MSLYKINKYIYKLKNTDISSDEFNIYLQKLNKYYLQHGGLFNIKKKKPVPLNDIIITHQPVLNIEIREIIQNVENFFTNFVFNDFIGSRYFSLKYICIPKISQKILLWGYYKNDEIIVRPVHVSSVHVIYNSLTNENKNNIYKYIIESYLNTFINETNLASTLYKKIVSDYSNFQKNLEKNPNLNWGFETVFLSFSISDGINVTIQDKSIQDTSITKKYINESVTLNQILNYIKTEIEYFKNKTTTVEDFEEIYNKTIEIVGQYSGNPEEAMTKFILEFEKKSADILKIICPTNIIIIDGLIDKTPINHLYNIKKISGNTPKEECPLYYTNTLKKSSTINLSETSIVHFFKNNLLNYNCIYKYMDDFLQKIQQDNIDKIQEDQKIFNRPVKNNNGQIKKDNDGQIKKDNSVPIKKDNRVNIKQKIQEIFMVWILYLSNSTQNVFTNFDNILIYDKLSDELKKKYKNTRQMLYKAVQCVFSDKDIREKCLNNDVIKRINQCNESNESYV